MKSLKLTLIVIAFYIFSPCNSWAKNAIPTRSHSLGVDLGYANGLGGALKYSFWNVTPGIPLGLHLSYGYFRQSDSGNATDARRIFINDNQGGEIEKYGTNWYLSFDLSLAIKHFYYSDFRIFGGARYVRYAGHFAFIGNNEAFAVDSSPFGFGFGIQANFFISHKMLLHLQLGLDYFMLSKLAGHGTYYYTPDGVDDKPRTNSDGYTYNYADANAAVNQPVWVGKIFVGISFLLF